MRSKVSSTNQQAATVGQSLEEPLIGFLLKSINSALGDWDHKL